MPENNKIDNQQLRSIEVQEILSNPPIWIVRWGITLIFIFTIIILVLANIIKYPDFVTARVLLTTEQPTERVFSRFSGQIEKVFIKNRDIVKTNNKLAVIRNTANYKDVYILKSIIDTLQFTSKNIKFPFDKTNELILGEISMAFINFEKSYTDYTLLKDLNPYSNLLLENRVSLSEIKVRLQNQIDQKELLEQEIELKRTDFKRQSQLFEKGIISKAEFESHQLEFIQMQKNISNMAISISQMREAISSASSSLRSTKINEQEDITNLLNNVLHNYNILKETIRDWEYKYVLKSSIEGVISFQNFWGENQFINTGDIAFSILPTNTTSLVGKLIISSQNAGKVKVGQKVFIKLDNYPYQQYGMLIGRVTNYSISPDDEGNYVVYISLPEGIKTSYNKTFEFNQELLGIAEIVTEDLSVAARIFYKFREVFKY